MSRKGDMRESKSEGSGNWKHTCAHTKRTLIFGVLQKRHKYMEGSLYYSSGILLISLRCVEGETKMKEKWGKKTKLSEGEENRGRVVFDTVTSVKRMPRIFFQSE